MPGSGKKLSDAYIELHADDSKLGPEVKVKATRVGREFGSALNRQLKTLNVDAVDLKADPKSAVASIEGLQAKLKAMSADAATVEVKIKTERAISELVKLRKKIGDVGGDSGGSFVSRFGATLSTGLSGLPLTGLLSVPVAAAAASAAPLLAAALSGAVIGGAGIGGVVGGLIIASKDQRVQAAGKDLADNLQKRLQSAAGVFVQPALEGIHEIEGAVDSIDIERIFREASQFVKPLAGGVSSAITDLGNAVEKLVSVAGPSIGVISGGIALIGKSLGEGLSSLADNGDTAAAALATLFNVIGSSIKSTFELVNLLTELYGISQKLGGDFVLQTFLKVTGTQMDKTAESSDALKSVTLAMGLDMQVAADKAALLAEQQKTLKTQHEAVTAAQEALNHSLDSLGGKTSQAAMNSDALKQAMDNLYGAAIRNTDANEGYQASFDALSETVKNNAGQFKHNRDNLDLHTKAGRDNRDALEALLTSSGELYLADIAAGKSTEYATGKHNARTEAVRREAAKVHLNKDETDKLIKTYDNIPPDKITKLLVQGVQGIINELKKLYTMQRALALGINIDLVTGTGTTKNFKAAGGPIVGPGTGTSDSVPIMASHGEFMQRASAVDYYGQRTMEDLNAKRIPRSALTGYAAGGLITPVDTSKRWPFVTDVSDSFVMSRKEAESKVIPAVPKGATLDFMVRVVRAAFPGLGLISGYRPGARTLSGAQSYHALHRASDWPASRPLAEWINLHYKARTKELITPWNDLNIHNGARHTYTGAVFNEHNFAGGNAHDHWAMDNGGALMPGWNPPIYNGTGRPEPVTPAPVMDVMVARLDRLIDAVERVAPGVGSVLMGTVPAARAAARQAGRSAYA